MPNTLKFIFVISFIGASIYLYETATGPAKTIYYCQSEENAILFQNALKEIATTSLLEYKNAKTDEERILKAQKLYEHNMRVFKHVAKVDPDKKIRDEMTVKID